MTNVYGLYTNLEGDYPLHQGDIQRLYPDFMNGDSLPEGWLLVVETEEPETVITDTEIQTFISGVSIVNGVATQTYTPVNRPIPPDPEVEEGSPHA